MGSVSGPQMWALIGRALPENLKLRLSVNGTWMTRLFEVDLERPNSFKVQASVPEELRGPFGVSVCSEKGALVIGPNTTPSLSNKDQMST